MQNRKRITDRQIAAIRGAGRHSVGDNLVLNVTRSGNRSWIARVTDNRSRRRDIGLGSYPAVSLSDAREAVRRLKNSIASGCDPLAERSKQSIPLFAQAAEKVYIARCDVYQNSKHRAQWIRSLEIHVFPQIGKIPVDELQDADIIKLLEPIWIRIPETAGRVLQRIATTTAWCVARGHKAHDISVKGIRAGLPPQPKSKRHFAAVPIDDAPATWSALSSKDPSTARKALMFAILTGARSGEARGANWNEIDLDNRIWTVPAERIKTRVEHRVPLSTAACELLISVAPLQSSDGTIFPNAKGQPLSDVALSKALKEFAPGFTVHGWRSTFRDWAAEKTDVPREIVEAALAHTNADRVEAAYRRTDYLEKRRPLMECWAEFLRGR